MNDNIEQNTATRKNSIYTRLRALVVLADRHLFISLGVFIVVAALLVVIASRISENSPETQAEAARAEVELAAESDRQTNQIMLDLDLDSVKFWLRDPESAKFTGTRRFKKNGKEITCGFVNSRNGFGGMSGPRSFAVVDHSVNILDMGSAAIDQIDKYC